MAVQIKEDFVVNGDLFSIGEFYEAFTDDLGRLFRDLQKEYGRCISKIYVDRGRRQEDNTLFVLGLTHPITTEEIGWVFQKRVPYTDCKDTYLREVWVEYRRQ